MYCYTFPSVILISLYVSSVLLEKINNGKGCFYKGSFHYGNWTDGCEFNCTCLDTDSGHYKCHTRCPVYPQLPPGCVLKLPVGEECCLQPDCSAVTVPYTIISFNNNNNNNNNINDNGNSNNYNNDNGNSNYNNSDNGNSNYNNSNNKNGNYNNYDNGNSNYNNNKYDDGNSNYNNNKYDNGNSNYNNNKYDNGNSDYNNNKYDNGNSNYNNNKYDNGNSNYNNNKYDNGNTNYNSNNGASDESNSTNNIDLNDTLNNTSMKDNGDGNGCLYKGKYYHGNWTDGCEFYCTCEDPVLGTYRCRKRCREYTHLDPGCILKQPSINDCCKQPECNSANLSTNIENNKSDIRNNKTTITTTLPPIFINFARTTSSRSGINPSSVTNRNQIDSRTISYKVITEANKPITDGIEVVNPTETEQLAKIFSRFGPFRLFKVGNDRKEHAKRPVTTNGILSGQQKVIRTSEQGFDNRNNFQRQTIIDTGDLVAKTGEVCNYKGRHFTQGQKWFDGCDFICFCENASRGLYKCRSRCTTYKNLPHQCVLRRSRVDTCCVVPDCRHATVAKGNKDPTTPRIVSTIRPLNDSDMAMLKRMFNLRHKMRNEPLQSAKDKVNRLEKVQTVQTITKDNKLDNRIYQNIDNIVEQTSTYRKYLQKDSRQSKNVTQDINFKKMSTNRSIPKQQIVTPISVSLGPVFNSAYSRTPRQKNGYRHQSFRTIATQTGIYKVRKKDGVIVAYKRPISKVFSKMLGASVPGNIFKEHNNSISGYCQYKDKRYTEGETWLDGCELLCFCQSGGRFVCHPRCLEYSRIPNGCALVPPRIGECCSLLVCRQISTRNNPPASYLNI